MKNNKNPIEILQYYAKYGFRKTIAKFSISESNLSMLIRKDRFYKIKQFYIDAKIIKNKNYRQLDKLELIELIRFKRRIWILGRALMMEFKDNV